MPNGLEKSVVVDDELYRAISEVADEIEDALAAQPETNRWDDEVVDLLERAADFLRELAWRYDDSPVYWGGMNDEDAPED